MSCEEARTEAVGVCGVDEEFVIGIGFAARSLRVLWRPERTGRLLDELVTLRLAKEPPAK